MTTGGWVLVLIAVSYFSYWIGRRKERAEWIASTLHRRRY